MRVTKLIKEYIVKKIDEAIPMTQHEEYTRVSKLYQDACDEYYDCLRNYAADLRTQLNTKYDLPEQWQLHGRKDYGCDFEGTTLVGVDYNCDLNRALRDHKAGIEKRRRDAIESILLELELGATKADLERLISEAISK